MTEDIGNVSESLAACDSALTQLHRLGRLADAEPAFQEAESIDYTGIANDETRNHDWKTAETARKYSANMDRLARRLSSAVNIATVQDRDDAHRVFGSTGLSGDPAALAASRHVAADRAAKIETPRDRMAALTDAVRVGDPVFARALCENAIQNGDHETTNEFIKHNPTLEPAVERLWAAARNAPARPDEKPMTPIWRVRGLRPQALDTSPNAMIANLARK